MACQCGGPRLIKFRCAHRSSLPSFVHNGRPLHVWPLPPPMLTCRPGKAATPATALKHALKCQLPLLLIAAGGGRRSFLPRPAYSTCWATACPLTGTTGWWTAAGRRSGA